MIPLLRTLEVKEGGLKLTSLPFSDTQPKLDEAYLTPQILEGYDAAQQIIANRVTLWRGDYFFDKERGINWISLIAKKVPISVIEKEITNIINQIDFVQSTNLVSFDIDKLNRKVALNINVTLIDNKIIQMEMTT